MSIEHLDVVVVGAGISGICAGYHLQKKCPDKRFAILEARDDLGGTWDLFRYPGIRSDSDMFTLGFPFRPWQKAQSIASGDAILEYIRDTAEAFGLDQKIRLQHRVVSASWDSFRAVWALTVNTPDQGNLQVTCRFLQICTGYYRYDRGYTPELEGMDVFEGALIHPQHWPASLDVRDKRVVVIGSGATAITLVPSLAREAGHVVMLQRSPTYVLSLPKRDAMAGLFGHVLPGALSYPLIRWKHIALHTLFYQLSRRRPALVKRLLRKQLRRALGPDFDIDTHFTPTYNPWDQRVCVVPDSDLFLALREGAASVVTDHIERLTKRGVLLRSGQQLDADIIVTATGLELLALGDMKIEVDGQPFDVSHSLGYRGVMLSDLPNCAVVLGYTNASWTLKANLSCDYIARLIAHMGEHHYTTCTPLVRDDTMERQPLIDLQSGYVQRGAHLFPGQGTKHPWRLHQNYFLDTFSLKMSRFQDSSLQFQ